MLTRDEAEKLAKKVIGMATFPECQVSISASEQAYTRFANNGITTASLNLRHTVARIEYQLAGSAFESTVVHYERARQLFFVHVRHVSLLSSEPLPSRRRAVAVGRR